ncbi:Mob protein [Leisingera aquaemixtae]|uniref:Mob protein n=1 Tax=Leisingera aquaemixtae TaxID=1396826 RepID=A0ABY5WH01_9RHOB|nr:Mob protein [Leisingera aquaemixtae]UWQ40732.1 Mob protein [Leisingera aquaemixtae]
MAYQFVHIETYSRKPRKVKGTKDQWNYTQQVFEEAQRNPDFSRHVENPRAPLPVLSRGAMAVSDLQALHDRRCSEIRETVTAKSGKAYSRSLRSDAPTLYTEIHSHPMASKDLLADRARHQKEIARWADLAVRDFRKRMPEGVAFAGVIHLDEAHVHMHILALNAGDPRLDANKLHVGKAAAAVYRAAHDKPQTLSSLPKPELLPKPKKPKKPRPSKNRVTQKKNMAKHEKALAEWQAACARVEAGNARKLEEWSVDNGRHLNAARKKRSGKNPEKAAFTAAMKAFQDRYYEAVGRPCGLLRKGPGHERLTTKQYAARKAGAKARAEEQLANLRFETQLEVREQALEARARRIEDEENSLKKKEAEVGVREETVLSREREVEARERVLEQETEQIRLREASLTEREAEQSLREEEAGAVLGRAEALILGLELIRRDQLRWVPDRKGDGGRLVHGPRDAAERPLPLKMHTRLEPAMSLLEILLKIIAEIIEDALHEQRMEIARDAEAVAECRRRLDLREDPVVTGILQRGTQDQRFDF